jgi:hypothetical protein
MRADVLSQVFVRYNRQCSMGEINTLAKAMYGDSGGGLDDLVAHANRLMHASSSQICEQQDSCGQDRHDSDADHEPDVVLRARTDAGAALLRCLGFLCGCVRGGRHAARAGVAACVLGRCLVAGDVQRMDEALRYVGRLGWMYYTLTRQQVDLLH